MMYIHDDTLYDGHYVSARQFGAALPLKEYYLSGNLVEEIEVNDSKKTLRTLSIQR